MEEIMQKYITNNNNHYGFSSVNEFADYLEQLKPYDSKRSDSSSDSGSSFSGTRSFEEAISKCKYGDPDIKKLIDEQQISLGEVNNVVNKIKTEYSLDVVGSVPHVPNAILNIPQNMIKVTRRQVRNKIINIFISLGANCHIDKEDMAKTAAKFAAAIDLLEKEGYRCNVFSGCLAGRSYSGNVGHVVKIKTDREPLNLSIMAFPMASPSMLRRLHFRVMEGSPLDFTHDGYGSTIDDKVELQKMVEHVTGLKNVAVLTISKDNGLSIKDVSNRLRID